MRQHTCRAARSRAARFSISVAPPERVNAVLRRSGPLPALLLLLALPLLGSACRATEELSAELDAVRLPPQRIQGWAVPAVESGHHEITVRQVFTAQGPCRELHGALMRRFPGEYLLRVEAGDASPCSDDSPHLGYTAVLRGMPAGRHQLRIVHVGVDGRTLAETALEHPIVVTSGPGR